jgi:uncharacterized membrane protein YfcA
MEILSAILLLLGGCLAGFVAGFFGVGGGIILVPVLLAYYQASSVTALTAIHLSIATSLFVVIFSALVSAYQCHTNGQVIWRAVVVVGSASVVGALLGSTIGSSMQAEVLRRIFGFAALITAIQLFGESRKPRGEQKPDLAIPGLAGTGLAIGGISALTGVGGGLFSIPLMYSVHRFPLMKALGTSSVTIVITAFAAVVGYAMGGRGNVFLPEGTLGYVDPLHAIPLIIGTIPCGILGARLARKTKVGMPRKIFAVVLLIVAVRMFFF